MLDLWLTNFSGLLVIDVTGISPRVSPYSRLATCRSDILNVKNYKNNTSKQVYVHIYVCIIYYQWIVLAEYFKVNNKLTMGIINFLKWSEESQAMAQGYLQNKQSTMAKWCLWYQHHRYLLWSLHLKHIQDILSKYF